MKVANTILYISVILSVLAIYTETKLFYVLWAISILIGVSFMVFKDRSSKKKYIWIALMIVALALVFYAFYR